MVELPSRAPAVVPMASLIMASFTWGMVPSALVTPTFSARPTMVPMVSKMLTSRREKMTMTILGVKKPVKSNWQKMGATLWGADRGIQPCGISVTPMGMPMSVEMMMA